MIALYAATAIDMPSAKSANIHFFMTHRLLCGDAPLHDRELLPIRTLDSAALRRKCAGFVIMNRRSTHADTPYGRASTTYREYNGFRARILPLTVFPSCADARLPMVRWEECLMYHSSFSVALGTLRGRSMRLRTEWLVLATLWTRLVPSC